MDMDVKEEIVKKEEKSLIPKEEEEESDDTDTATTTANNGDSTVPSYLPILSLCWVVALLSALDRVAMSVAILPLSTEYHLAETVKGQISSVFSLGYGVAIIPCGLLIASQSPKKVMASGVALWSLATIGTPIAASLILVDQMPSEDGVTFIAQNVAPLLLVRTIMGGAESVVLPAIQRIIAKWVPPSNKSFAIAGVYTGFQSGTVLAYLASPFIIDNLGLGWKGLFYLYGGIGAAWLVPWLIYARDAPDGDVVAKLLGEEEDEYCDVVLEEERDVTFLVNSMREDDASLLIERRDLASCMGEEEEEKEDDKNKNEALEEALSVLKAAPWSKLIKSPGVWAMTLAHAANNWGLYNSLSWTPTFYAEQYGLNVKESAFLSVLPSVAGAIGGIVAGSVADKIIVSLNSNLKENDTMDSVSISTNVRKTFQAIALFGPGLCLLTLSSHIPDQPLTAQALLTGTVGLQAFNAAGYGAATQEKAGEKWSGLLYSITSLPGVMFGSLGVYVTGQILDATSQDWSIVWGLTGCINILGALAFVWLYDSKKEFD